MAESEKARLYRQIVQLTSEQQLVERMRLHGFWPDRQELPAEPPAETAERSKIAGEMTQIRKAHSLVKNPEKALAVERKRRWDESKKRRAEAKAQRQQQAQERREQYAAFQKTHLVHAGAGYSAGLQYTTTAVQTLTKRGLPVIVDAADFARQMGITLNALRWLTFHRRSATVVHYHRFSIAKKTGGVRCISAPKPALAKAQRWVYDNILSRLEVEPQAHGFVPGRSIVGNAKPHVGRAIVANMDVKDFFPTVTFRRVKGLFQCFGYSEQVATSLALLCTEPPRVAAEIDGKVYHVALGDRILPQGACTSPAITNALCRRLDRRLTALAKRHGFSYTRYADDLTFSGDNKRAIGRLLWSVRSILITEGFSEQATKTRVMRRASRQEVTGLTVNTRPSVSRKEVRQLRAILHNAAKHGLASQNRGKHPDFAAYLRGRVEFVCMVDPRLAEKFKPALKKALATSSHLT